MLTLTHRRKMVPVLTAVVLAAVITAGAAPATAQAKTADPIGRTGLASRGATPTSLPAYEPVSCSPP